MAIHVCTNLLEYYFFCKKGVYESVGCVSYCAQECSVCKFSCVYTDYTVVWNCCNGKCVYPIGCSVCISAG